MERGTFVRGDTFVHGKEKTRALTTTDVRFLDRDIVTRETRFPTAGNKFLKIYIRIKPRAYRARYRPGFIRESY